MISMIDRPELTSQRRWIHDLWSGLKLLAESGLTDFQPLHSAKRAIATEEQAAWGALIGDLESQVVALRREEVADDTIFLRCLAALNHGWCLQRKILVSQLKRITWMHHESDLWDCVPVSIRHVLQQQAYQFHDFTVPAYWVQTVCPSFYSDHSAYFSPSMKCVVLNIDRIKWEAMLAGSLFAPGGSVHKFSIGQRLPSFAVAALEHYHRLLAQWHKDADGRELLVFLRTLYEELSHAIHGLRAGLEGGSLQSYKDHLVRLAESLLAPGGRLRQEVWEADVLAPPGPELLDTQAAFGRGCGEMAAQMTAAAVNPDPYLVLLEWWYWVRAISQAPTGQPLEELLAVLQTDGPHFMAATMGIVLLADQMGLPHYSSLTGVWLAEEPQGQCSLLEELARRLMERGRPEIRLALKAVFQREFGHAIDEVPFNGIDAAGKLVPRRASGSDAATPPGS